MFRGIQHLLESEISILPAQLVFPCSILQQNKSYFIISSAAVIFVKRSAALRTCFRNQRGANVKVTPCLWNGCQLTIWFNFDFIPWGGRARDSYSCFRDLDLITPQDLYSLYNSAHKSLVCRNKQQYEFQTCTGEHVGALCSFVSLFKGGVNKTHKAAT